MVSPVILFRLLLVCRFDTVPVCCSRCNCRRFDITSFHEYRLTVVEHLCVWYILQGEFLQHTTTRSAHHTFTSSVVTGIHHSWSTETAIHERRHHRRVHISRLPRSWWSTTSARRVLRYPVRVSIQKNERRRSSTDSEPNFYLMRHF
jgi:hypothetical protein